MPFLKITFIIFLSISAFAFYLQTVDGPYALDLKLDLICPGILPGDAYNDYKCYRHSLTNVLNEKLENTFGISRWTMNEWERILSLLFLPILAIAVNFYDYRTSRTHETSTNFGKLYFHSALVVIVASGLGVLPSAIMGFPTCLGGYCSTAVGMVFVLAILTLLFALISSGIARYFIKRGISSNNQLLV